MNLFYLVSWCFSNRSLICRYQEGENACDRRHPPRLAHWILSGQKSYSINIVQKNHFHEARRQEMHLAESRFEGALD